jgi:hypothetical protein
MLQGDSVVLQPQAPLPKEPIVHVSHFKDLSVLQDGGQTLSPSLWTLDGRIVLKL